MTGYTITPIGPDGPLIPTATGPGVTSTTLSGLTNGTAYRFAVTATNRAGTSPAGESASVSRPPPPVPRRA